ncbi:MAG: adenylate/guanylate cyclase domain-containing protein [Desulfobacteraceae bacterium]|nr:adenylate/guanylate cyclase domain-containing protein [Desulfobacteraceae bacterium]
MNNESFDIKAFERRIFRTNDVLGHLLKFALDLMDARQVGLLIGTNQSYLKFLPPEKWDRGVMHKLDGKGITGWFLKYFGNLLVWLKGLSPIYLYQKDEFGKKTEKPGIISYVLRKHQDFYQKGIKILIISNIPTNNGLADSSSHFSIFSFNGKYFNALPDIPANIAIIKEFNAQNFLSAYIPDYGAIVFNTVNKSLLEQNQGQFVNQKDLKKRLNTLSAAIEISSLAYIGLAKGRQAVKMIRRKEKNLRETALRLKKREIELNEQKQYLQAVGAVNKHQLNMAPVNVQDGVYAFVDMVGSTLIRKQHDPKDYFLMLNTWQQIAANNAARFFCRLGNFIGDCVFFQNVAVFDQDENGYIPELNERVMLMVMLLVSVFQEFDQVVQGTRSLDSGSRIKAFLNNKKNPVRFRAGIEIGPALIGPVGSEKRKIVTAIGETVDNASRMESSGTAQGIHIGKNILDILQNSLISKDTRMLWQVVAATKSCSRLQDTSIGFIDFFKKEYGIEGDPFLERKNISFKEFSKKTTYLIKCFPNYNYESVRKSQHEPVTCL